jgi:glutaredoxin
MHAAPTFTVYSRSYCHLCEEMIDQLRPLAAEIGFDFDVVDVDSEPSLEAQFGEWVPVLVVGDTQICHYHLDVDALRAYLAHTR